MNLLFVDQFSDLGGAQRCLLDLLPAVRERGWQATVAAPGQGPLLELAARQGAAVESLPEGRYRSGRKSAADFARFAVGAPRLSRAIRDLLARRRAGLLYVNGPRMLPPAAWADRGRVPAVFHAHSYLTQPYAAALARWALRSSRATVIASCRFVTGPLRLRPDAPGVEVVYNGVGDSGFRRSRPSGGGLRVGVLGRVAPEKGQLCLVQAARRVLPAFPDCRFVVGGAVLFGDRQAGQYFERVRREAAGLPVEFPGWSDPAQVLAGLDLLVVPSTGPEATTRVIPEAWSAGVPVVASATGGIAEIVEDGRTGLLCAPGSPEALASRIAQALRDPEQRQRLAEAGRAAYEERFTLGRYRAQILELLERLLRGQAP